MTESVWLLIALCASSFLAGAVNSIAGGGTLLTFPALLAVVSPVVANGTNTVALLPGSFASAWAFRQTVRHPPRLLIWLFAPSLVGGLLGTLLVTRTPESYFAALVPWLILLAATLFALQPFVARMMGSRSVVITSTGTGRLALLAGAQLVVAIYGGYFGAGIGILMLSALAYMGLNDVHEMNALKTILAGLINSVSAVLFFIDGKVNWQYAAPMAVSAIAGGYLGARWSMRFPSAAVRRLVIVIGFSLAAYYFYKRFVGMTEPLRILRQSVCCASAPTAAANKSKLCAVGSISC